MRGSKAKTGATRIAPNGYHYTKTRSGKWRLTHHIVAEKKLGRAIRQGERVVFIDGDRTNITQANVDVKPIRQKTTHARKAVLEAKIEDLKAQLEELEDA